MSFALRRDESSLFMWNYEEKPMLDRRPTSRNRDKSEDNQDLVLGRTRGTRWNRVHKILDGDMFRTRGIVTPHTEV